MCMTWRIALLKFALLLRLWCHKHLYPQTFFSSVFIFCVNSNCIRQIIKKAMLSQIHLKNWKHASFPQSLKSDARFGTGTTFACATTIFFHQGVLPKIIHHFAVENASKQLATTFRAEKSLSNSTRSVVKIYPPPPPLSLVFTCVMEA